MRRIDFRLSTGERVTYMVCAPFFIAAFAYVLFGLSDMFGSSLGDRVGRAFVIEVFVMIECILILGFLRCMFPIVWLDRAVQWCFDHMMTFYSGLATFMLAISIVVVYFDILPAAIADAAP